MKKFCALACVLIFLGSGCLASGDEVSDVIEVDNSMPVPAEESVVETVVEDDINEAPRASVTITDGLMTVKQVDMKSGNFFFDPASIVVEAGQEVEITFTQNTGTHTFVIDELNLKATVKAGETIKFTAPEKGGDYSYYCNIGNHRAQGMEGILRVK